MSVLVVNLPLAEDEPTATEIVQLDGASYRLLFQWRERASGWYVTISSRNPEAVQVAGSRVAQGQSLLLGHQYNTLLPPGRLVPISLDPNDDSDPGLNELGNGRRVVLVYFSQDELADEPAFSLNLQISPAP